MTDATKAILDAITRDVASLIGFIDQKNSDTSDAEKLDSIRITLELVLKGAKSIEDEPTPEFGAHLKEARRRFDGMGNPAGSLDGLATDRGVLAELLKHAEEQAGKP